MKKYFLFTLFIATFANAQPNNSSIEHVELFQPYLGTSYNMYIGNRMPFVDVYTMGANGNVLFGKFVVDYGTDVSVIDTSGFPCYYISKNTNNVYPITFKTGDITFQPNDITTGPFNRKCNLQNLNTVIANGIREAGIVGTDILSKLIITLDYDYSRLYIVWDTTKQCTPSIMKNKGFLPVSTKGFFDNNIQNLRSPNNNIPTIPIVIGDQKDSAQAFAQIDPGYDDRCHLKDSFDTYYTHILNINQLYYEHLKKKGIDIQVDRSKYYTVNNLPGIAPDTLFKCSFLKSYNFSAIGTSGETVIPYHTDEVNVFLKVNAPGGERAGGITTMPFPAVQFGGSILMDCRKTTFDPFRSLIWFQSRRNL
jgi:hypothetical protein